MIEGILQPAHDAIGAVGNSRRSRSAQVPCSASRLMERCVPRACSTGITRAEAVSTILSMATRLAMECGRQSSEVMDIRWSDEGAAAVRHALPIVRGNTKDGRRDVRA